MSKKTLKILFLIVVVLMIICAVAVSFKLNGGDNFHAVMVTSLAFILLIITFIILSLFFDTGEK